MRLLIVIAALLLVGCDQIVSTRIIGDTVEKGMTSCYKTDFCFTCGPGIGFDGSVNVSCRLQISPMCPGEQPARIRYLTEERTHESGKKSHWSYSRVMERLGDCR